MAELYLAISTISTNLIMEANNSNVQVHFSIHFIISGVVELYRNVGGGIFTLEDEEVCVLVFFCCCFFLCFFFFFFFFFFLSYFFSSAERVN